jgi:hypothetical protein
VYDTAVKDGALLLWDRKRRELEQAVGDAKLSVAFQEGLLKKAEEALQSGLVLGFAYRPMTRQTHRHHTWRVDDASKLLKDVRVFLANSEKALWAWITRDPGDPGDRKLECHFIGKYS